MGLIVAAPGIASAQEAAADQESQIAGIVLTVLIYLVAIAALAWFWKKDHIRPGSFSRNEPAEAPPIEAGPALFAIMIGCFVLSSIAAIVVSDAQGINVGEARTFEQQGVFNLVVGAAGIVASVLGLLLAKRFWNIGRFRIGRAGWIAGVVLGVLVYPITAAVGQLSLFLFTAFSDSPPDAIGHDTLDSIVSPEAGVWRWAFIAGAVVATPIFEEVLFRGLLQSAVLSIVRKPWLAILIASSLFTAMHISSGIEPHTLPAIGTLGLAMGIAYERTGKISVPIAMHAVFNAFNVGLSFALS
ncbi:MAG: lysostaphin resistance A-like protein [Phycisphaerales bacterium JB061]